MERKPESRAIPVPAWKGSGCWLSASRLVSPGDTRDFPPGSPLLCPSPPRGKLRPLIPAAVPGSPSLCSPESESMLRAASWESTAASPRGARAGVLLGLPRLARARQCAAASARGRLGRDERRPRPAPRAPRPVPAREASAGLRVGRAGRARGGGRGGASWEERERPALRVRRTGVKYPRAVPLLHPRPESGVCTPGLAERGGVVRVGGADPFHVWPSLEVS